MRRRKGGSRGRDRIQGRLGMRRGEKAEGIGSLGVIRPSARVVGPPFLQSDMREVVWPDVGTWTGATSSVDPFWKEWGLPLPGLEGCAPPASGLEFTGHTTGRRPLG